MDAKQFLAEFGHIANAPGGILKLRGLVLSLAFQGKLVEQHTGNGAHHYLDEINNLKDELVSSGEIPKQRYVPDISENEIPHKIPDHWVWVRFGNISYHNSGKTLDKKRNSGTKRDYITTSNLYWGRFDLSNLRQVPVEDKNLEKCTAKKGDLLICEGGEAGRAAVWDFDYDICFQNHIHRVRFFAYVNSYFAYRFFEKLSATGEILEYRKGIGISSMSGKALASIPFMLPPIEEQARIVAKVDELMTLCDKLEEQQQQKRQLQNQLREATLQAVAASTSPFELKQHWARLQGNFEQLFSVPDDVNKLRELVLDLAVNGHLTQNLESDENSGELLNKIYQAKRDGISQGKIKKKKPVVGEMLSAQFIKSYWEQLRLDDAIINIDAGWSPKCLVNSRKDEDTWGVLKTTSVQVLKFLPIEHKELPASLDPRTQYEVKLGDILVTRAGPNNRVGICCVVDNAPPKLMISDKLIRFHIVDDLIDARFVALCLSAGESGRIFESMKTGMAESQMNITQDRLRSVPIPLPPKAEQNRILARVEELIDLCDHYENKLTSFNKLAEYFAAASIANLTGISTPQEEKPLKIPQTELVAPVTLGPNKPNSKDAAPLAALLARQNGQMNANDLWQRFGGEVDTFYAQLKTEVAHGWIDDPSYFIANNDQDRKNNFENPRLYPDGNLVAKVIIKDSAT